MAEKEQTTPALTPEELAKIEELAGRIRRREDGRVEILRFNKTRRIEHWALIVSFTVLAVTGLVQRYSDLEIFQVIINSVFGGIDVVQLIHRVFAFVFALEAIIHLFYAYKMIREKRIGKEMLLEKKDIGDLGKMVGFNIGKRESAPRFGRYSVEEKFEYWASIWGGLVMAITGLIQWFPVQATRFLPGAVVPISRAIHSWEAILAVVAVIFWHMYHTVIKEQNTSIFSGYMSEEMMKEMHPVEYEQIMEARKALLKHRRMELSKAKNGGG